MFFYCDDEVLLLLIVASTDGMSRDSMPILDSLQVRARLHCLLRRRGDGVCRRRLACRKQLKERLQVVAVDIPPVVFNWLCQEFFFSAIIWHIRIAASSTSNRLFLNVGYCIPHSTAILKLLYRKSSSQSLAASTY